MTRATAAFGGAIALLACLATLAASPAVPAAEPKVRYQDESESAFHRQLAAGEIREAIVNKRIRTLRLTLADGSRKLARYPRKQSRRVIAAMRAKGVAVSVLSPSVAKAEVAKLPKHHKLRYIAAGVLGGVIVIVGGVLLYRRRRRAA